MPGKGPIVIHMSDGPIPRYPTVEAAKAAIAGNRNWPRTWQVKWEEAAPGVIIGRVINGKGRKALPSIRGTDWTYEVIDTRVVGK